MHHLFAVTNWKQVAKIEATVEILSLRLDEVIDIRTIGTCVIFRKVWVARTVAIHLIVVAVNNARIQKKSLREWNLGVFTVEEKGKRSVQPIKGVKQKLLLRLTISGEDGATAYREACRFRRKRVGDLILLLFGQVGSVHGIHHVEADEL